jgi:hypothetical protein
VAVRDRPSVAVPAIVGGAVLRGGTPADDADNTTFVGADVADFDPEAFVAVTRARNVLPTSPSTSR